MQVQVNASIVTLVILVSSNTKPSENIAVSTTPISQGDVDPPVIKESNNTLSSTSSSAKPVTSIFFMDVEHPVEVLLSETTLPVETKNCGNDD